METVNTNLAALHHPNCDCELCVEARKILYFHNREIIKSKSLLSEARQMLFNLLQYQPALSFFHPADTMWKVYAPPLIEGDYLSPRIMNGFSVLYIRPKAKVEYAERM